MGFITSVLYSQLFVTLPIPAEDFSGQTCIVTGSNTGLGLEAARHLSRLNTSLLMLAVRNQAKGEAAKKDILASTKRADTLPRLDVVLEYAGIMTKYFKNVEGFESTITTNVIGTLLLALGLLPTLKQSALENNTQARLSIVASELHFIAKFPERNSKDFLKALNDEKSDMSMERYMVSKLIEVLCVHELASLLSKNSNSLSPPVIINCMTPGACKSDFHRENSAIESIIQSILDALFARTTEAGSRTLVAGVAAGTESHSQYMADCLVATTAGTSLESTGPSVAKHSAWLIAECLMCSRIEGGFAFLWLRRSCSEKFTRVLSTKFT
ncbi:hypothetical protein VTL71DRAFT_6575 [Oculimacula yallundae]|uniref:Short-chain dehydrogenase/reductase n=1 Tax=Oculimacula yallundae TaxID=86028 RepID=A0ABR4BXA9_9HELO